VKHRSLIAYGAWSSLAHGFTMSIQSAEAAAHGIHRNDSPWTLWSLAWLESRYLHSFRQNNHHRRLSVSRALPNA